MAATAVSAQWPPTELVQALAAALQAKGWQLALAESCTGGLVASCCTAQAGSSSWFYGGLVTYSNDAKEQWLGVPSSLIAQEGAVSEAVALQMAAGLFAKTQAERCLSLTGIAGPGGAVPGKPVGTVWLAWACQGHLYSRCLNLSGDRLAIQRQSTVLALEILIGSLA